MNEGRRHRFTTNPVVRVMRWILPWVLLGLVANAAWGIASDFRKASSSAPPAAIASTDTVGAVVTTEDRGKRLYTVSDSVSLYDVPSTSATVLRKMRRSTLLIVMAEQNHWYRVRDAAGNIGWVPNDVGVVSAVKPAAVKKATVAKKTTRKKPSEKKVDLGG